MQSFYDDPYFDKYDSSFRPAKNDLRKATVFDYILWLDAYVQKGGRSFSYYDYPFSSWHRRFFYSDGNYTIECGCGSEAKHVIVGPGSLVSFSNPHGPFRGHGHCQTYVWGGELMGGTFDRAPIFNDWEFLPYIERYGIVIPDESIWDGDD